MGSEMCIRDRYYKDDSKIRSLLYEIAALFLISYFVALGWDKYKYVRERRWKKKNPDIALESNKDKVSFFDAVVATIVFKFFVPLFISVCFAIFLWTCLQSAPFNWVAIAFLSFLTNPVRMSDCTGIAAGGIMSWLARKLNNVLKWN